MKLGVAQGNGAAEPLKVGESLGSAWDRVPIPSQARLSRPGRCRDWMGGA
jgi:hypothetical protein